jgi:acetate---CoA ligase (ADP-forming)
MIKNTIDLLFNPKQIALVGASADPAKIGHRLAENILARSYKGEVFLINPKGITVCGRKSIKTIEELPEGVDCALLSIPKKHIIHSIRECIGRKVKNIVVLTAGFKEIGDEGIRLEQEVRDLLEVSETRLVGPNCAGFTHTGADLHATIEIYPQKGSISFISQSGSICSAFSSNVAARSTGISKYISLGNKVNLNEADFIEYFGEDDETACIALYLEDIADGTRLRQAASRAAVRKPIVVFKSGRTPEGAKATFSHTGAMAGDDKLVEGAFRQMGIVRVDNLTELYDLSSAFTVIPAIHNNRIAILSDAGGPGVIAADAVIQDGLVLPRLSENVQEELYTFLPSFSSVLNPIDMTFTRDVDLYGKCIEVLKKEDVGAVIVTIPSHFAVKEEMVTVLTEAKEKHGIPIVVAWLSADEVETERRALWANGIPCFNDPQRASAVLKKIFQYSRWLALRND